MSQGIHHRSPIPFRTRPGYSLQQRIRGDTGATEQDNLSVLDACLAVARASAYSAFCASRRFRAHPRAAAEAPSEDADHPVLRCSGVAAEGSGHRLTPGGARPSTARLGIPHRYARAFDPTGSAGVPEGVGVLSRDGPTSFKDGAMTSWKSWYFLRLLAT